LLVVMRSRIILLLTLLVMALGWQVCRAQEPNRAAVVIRFGDGSTTSACVSFSEETVSGAELLRRSGLTVIMDPHSGFGEAVCKISDGQNADGCEYPAQECFCQCQSAECVYWAYYHLQGGRWVYSEVGPSNWQVKNGDVEGYAWGPGSREGGNSEAEPPPARFDEICGAKTTTVIPATPAVSDQGTDSNKSLLYFGGFGLVLVLLIAAGAWALRRQSG